MKDFGVLIKRGLFLVMMLCSTATSTVQDPPPIQPVPPPMSCGASITANQTCVKGTYTGTTPGPVSWSGTTSTTFDCRQFVPQAPGSCTVCGVTTVSTSPSGADGSFVATGTTRYASASGSCDSQGNIVNWGENQGPLDPTQYYQLNFFSVESNGQPCNQIDAGSYNYFGSIKIGISH